MGQFLALVKLVGSIMLLHLRRLKEAGKAHGHKGADYVKDSFLLRDVKGQIEIIEDGKETKEAIRAAGRPNADQGRYKKYENVVLAYIITNCCVMLGSLSSFVKVTLVSYLQGRWNGGL